MIIQSNYVINTDNKQEIFRNSLEVPQNELNHKSMGVL